MLGLAHGMTGIELFSFTSFWQSSDIIVKGIIDNRYSINPSNLYYHLKDILIPRLKGKLGKTLMNLDYTGDYIQSYYEIPSQIPLPDPQTIDYLTLGYGNYTAHDMLWHCGFFDRFGQPDNKYFLLANLYQGAESNTIKVRVKPPEGVEGYENYRFRNVEGYFDETFKTEIIMNLTLSKGEGYLYQVAPVVLYGGRLLNDENVGEGQVLSDDMTIENGKTLTIYNTYTSNANITVKNGNIIVGENGKIIFDDGKKLIIDGVCTISGTSVDKLRLVFSTPVNDDPIGIMIKAGGSLTINNCTIENATIGIQSLLNTNYLNVQNVDFIDCSDVAISIAGYNSSQILTPPTPSIMYCTITNSGNGISAANLSQIIIRENDIIGSNKAIFLSSVSTPAVIGNYIVGTGQDIGILLTSCNGVVRRNSITNHTNGIHLGNSSPDIGGNIIFQNLNRGIYISIGSLPNMQGKLVRDPLHNVFYAVSGYNRIYDNGGWNPDDDGSEIFIKDANIKLAKGCNEITDQRLPDLESNPPLFNTQFLMNCDGSFQIIEVKAGGNFWDEHRLYRLDERFGSCRVYYDPALAEPCPQPDGNIGKLIITSATGETIDTLYAEARDIETLTETEQMYATAEENFLTTDLNVSEILYHQIIDGNDSLDVKLDAYRRLYEIGKLTGRDESYFNNLRDTYLSLAGVSTDSLMVKTFNQLSTLSLISNQEYVPAINEFDAIIQQNPNTEEAVYAEIDALTTALLIEEADSTLHKGRLGKYLIKSTSDYNEKIDEILRKYFGGNSKETLQEILPTEYTLYQNYPNPFNPITTIKYDLPDASDVSLIIYDILGRKVKELVNTKQQTGRYEIQFDASNLASGIYIYQLIADKFISSKKMILLK